MDLNASVRHWARTISWTEVFLKCVIPKNFVVTPIINRNAPKPKDFLSNDFELWISRQIMDISTINGKE